MISYNKKSQFQNMIHQSPSGSILVVRSHISVVIQVTHPRYDDPYRHCKLPGRLVIQYDDGETTATVISAA